MAEDFRIQFQDDREQQHGRDLRSPSDQSSVREARLQKTDVLPDISIELGGEAEVSEPASDVVAESFAPPPEAEEHHLDRSWRRDPTIEAEFKVDFPKPPVSLDLATLRAVTCPFDGTNFGLPGIVAGLSEVADRVERVRKCRKLEGTIMSIGDLSDTAAGVENIACTFGRNYLHRFIPTTGAISTSGNEFILGLQVRDDEHKRFAIAVQISGLTAGE